MAPRVLICPLCGFEFERPDTLCQHGCPFNDYCDLVRCPSCEYEFPERPRVLAWFRSLFRRFGRPGCEVPHGAATVRDLASGEQAVVLSLEGRDKGRHNSLAVFGLVPGAEIRLIQRRPSFVLRVGETELALDEEIAREILVERTLPGPQLVTAEET